MNVIKDITLGGSILFGAFSFVILIFGSIYLTTETKYGRYVIIPIVIIIFSYIIGHGIRQN